MGRGTASRRLVVEGESRKRNNTLDDAISVAQHFGRRYPQDAVAILYHESVTSIVAHEHVAVLVPFAINLDHRPSPRAVEISDIRSDRMLLAEFQPCPHTLYALPNQYFRQAHFSAELASSINFGAVHFGHTPSTTSFAGGPPPRAGEDHGCHPFLSIQAAQLPFARSRTRPI